MRRLGTGTVDSVRFPYRDSSTRILNGGRPTCPATETVGERGTSGTGQQRGLDWMILFGRLLLWVPPPRYTGTEET